MKGRFISFEGIDGAGKSTHVSSCVALLQEKLAVKNINVVSVREPGGTPLGEELRRILLSQKMSPLTESLLMFASRRQLIDEVIAPALMRGDWVVSDRFVDASFAYQGSGRGVSADFLEQLRTHIVGECLPDLTFWFDVEATIAQARREINRPAQMTDPAQVSSAPDRFEQENQDFFNRVREGYHQLWRREPNRIVRIDAQSPILAIQEQLREQLHHHLLHWV